MKKIIFLVFFILFFITNIFSQNNKVGEKYVFEFRDGTTIIGTFIKEEQGNIYITDESGKETYIPEVMVVNVISFEKESGINCE